MDHISQWYGFVNVFMIKCGSHYLVRTKEMYITPFSLDVIIGLHILQNINCLKYNKVIPTTLLLYNNHFQLHDI